MAGSAVPTLIEHRQRGVSRVRINVTTDASGDATATAVGPVFGRLLGYLYNGGLDASATITIKDEKTGATIFTHTTGTEGTPVFLRPTTIVATNAGAAITAADTAPNVNRPITVNGRLTVTVAGGGNLETCKIGLIVDERGLGDLALTV